MSSLTCEILGTGWILVSSPWREYFSTLTCMCICVGLVGVSKAATLGMFPYLCPASSFGTVWPRVSLPKTVALGVIF